MRGSEDVVLNKEIHIGLSRGPDFEGQVEWER